MVLNWVDWIILTVAFYYLWEGWGQGVIALLASFVSFLGSLWIAVRFHGQVGAFLVSKFGIPSVWTTVLGYLIVGFVSEFLIAEALAGLVARIPHRPQALRFNKLLGALLGLGNSLVLVAFLLLVILALPIRGTVKQDIKKSIFGKQLVNYAQIYGGQVTSAIEDSAREAIKFLTIEPTSGERIALPIGNEQLTLTADEAGERQMLDLVNAERGKVGASKLTLDTPVRAVARAHSRDMFERRYFSHINPEGEDVGQRLDKAGISFAVAGENLAYAPDVAAAHQGLMQSPGHRRN
ncbi:CvpA family protein, partial [Candidatus Gottesmanbacteria bacterium]|nr:CvpA family protein [Candidatus Gottesmanbacteria bacterium]